MPIKSICCSNGFHWKLGTNGKSRFKVEGARKPLSVMLLVNAQFIDGWLNPLTTDRKSQDLAPTVNLIERSSLPLCKRSQI